MAKRKGQELVVRGDLQADIMSAVWKLGEAKVEDVRRALPGAQRSAYNTVQTVMNRLVERGLLLRKRRGNAFAYTARYDEGEYLAKTLGDRLAAASADARREALVGLVGGLESADLDELARYANRIKRARGKS